MMNKGESCPRAEGVEGPGYDSPGCHRVRIWRPFCPFSSPDPGGTQCPGLQQLGTRAEGKLAAERHQGGSPAQRHLKL